MRRHFVIVLSAQIRVALLLVIVCSVATPLSAQSDTLSLSLYDCIQYHRDSPEVSIQLETRRQGAQATRLKAQSNLFPQISLSGGWLYTPAKLKPYSINLGLDRLPLDWLPQIPFLPGIKSAQSWLDKLMSIEIGHVFYGAISLRQPIFAGGRIYQGVRLAQIGEQAVDYQWMIEQRNQEEQIAKTYWQAVQLQEQLQIVHQFITLLDKTLDDVTAMHEQGVVANRELVSVRVSSNSAKIQEGKLQEGLRALQILLKHQCRIPSDRKIRLGPNYTTGSQLPIGPIREQVSSTASPMERIELKAAALAVEAEERRAKMALGEMLPEIGLTGQVIAASPDPFDGFKKQFGRTWLMGIAVQIPITGIYQGAQSRTAALANQRVRQLELQDAERAVKMQCEQATHQLTEALVRYKESQQVRTDAQLNLDLSAEGYREGVISLETLSLAQRNWFDAEMQYIELLIAVHQAEVALNVATGQEIYL